MEYFQPDDILLPFEPFKTLSWKLNHRKDIVWQPFLTNRALKLDKRSE